MPDQTPSMPPLPVPFGYHSGFAWAGAHSTYCHITLTRQPHPGYEKPLYTSEQVQAVADERVREALERAAQEILRTEVAVGRSGQLEYRTMAEPKVSALMLAELIRGLARPTLSLGASK